MNYRMRGLVLVLTGAMTAYSGPSGGQTLTVRNTRITGHAHFDVRGQYGAIPRQTATPERDYEWWVPGRVGFWEYQMESGAQAVFSERITVRLTLTTTGQNADRDFWIWGNETPVKVRFKEAGIRLNRLWTSRLALEGGRLAVDYPLFTVYDYTGGRLIFYATRRLTIDWGQWQVFEGRTVDQPGRSSDDIDLWGPQARWQTPYLQARFYALIHSKAGGSDGIGNNVKIFGLASELTPTRVLRLEADGVLQQGRTSTPIAGQRDIRTWALRGQLSYQFSNRMAVSGEYWAGAGDKPNTPKVNEAFQQFGYRNTLEKSSLLYRPGLTDLRLIRGGIQGPLGPVTGRMTITRIGEGGTGHLGTEIGVSMEYPYTAHARLRWRWATTFDGQRIQMFELSSGFGKEIDD